MIRFNKLRVIGFKSFVESSDFVIEGGLTGVVGPNGCGKSNLVEAIRWVMGENSYKNMRASGMEDVIFSGSGKRPSRNSAEVILYLDNKQRLAPAAFNNNDELQISRKIERDRGSTYRINGKEARAKDVQLLFADQSTGARSPSMVGQGRVGELIQAKPQARRALLEEAAGISGLHSRRHEAELRLRAAESNLERLDDVTAQLTSQIESLKRQARQAIRFKALSEELRQSEATLFHLRWTEAKDQEGDADSALAKATSLVGAAAQVQVEAAKAQAVGSFKLPELRENEAKAAAIIQRITIAQEQLEQDARRTNQQRDELVRRIEQLKADITREQGLAADNEAILKRLADEEATLKSQIEGASTQENNSKQAMEQAASEVALADKNYQEQLNRKAQAEAQRTALKRVIDDNRSRLDRAMAQLSNIDRETTTLDQRLSGLPDIVEKRAALELAEAALTSAEATALTADEKLEAARKVEEAARPAHSEARGTLDRIETEARTLAKLVNAKGADLFAPVLDKIIVARGYETALGAALGEDLDLPLDKSAAAYWFEIASKSDDPKLPDGIEQLANHVKAPPALARRLAQIGLVKDHDEGTRLAQDLAAGQRLVAQDGALWRWDGVHISADAPSPAAIRLEQKNRLADLDSEAVDATKILRAAEAALQEARNGVEQSRENERVARQDIRNHQQFVADARKKLGEAERLTGEIAARRQALVATREQVAATVIEAENTLAETENTQKSLPDLSQLFEDLTRVERILNATRSDHSEARAAFEGVRRDNEARSKRLETIDKERNQWLTRAAGASEQIAALTTRKDKAEVDLKALEALPDDLAVKRRELSYKREQADKDRKAASDILANAENKQRQLDQTATDAIQALSTAREERARSEERANAANARRTEIEERIADAMRCAPHEVFAKTGLGPDSPIPKPADIERQIERLRNERERLGAVNLRAEEEQTELTEQFETLVSERGDVVEAIKKLRSAIQGLNREGRERLLAAFEVVNEHFKTLFSRLFGGGTAELQLIDSDDPLEAGLDILARPPGKRPQTMTLLSGGEQALTAMAMIFAVFLTNPAPICVLDEVDAPLDDHNVERFCDLMDEMVKMTETRFVLITHNPITMARMDRLFGVTMAEQGVSQLVSVDLHTAEQLRETA